MTRAAHPRSNAILLHEMYVALEDLFHNFGFNREGRVGNTTCKSIGHETKQTCDLALIARSTRACSRCAALDL